MKRTNGGKKRNEAAAMSFGYVHHKEYVTGGLCFYAIMVSSVILHIYLSVHACAWYI